VTLDLSHLTAAARELAFRSAEDRIRLIHGARWVSYPRAQIVLEHFERLFHFPPCTRMPCVLLYGDSGIGKTMILEKFARGHGDQYDQKEGKQRRPIVTAQMPPAPDERRLYTSILVELGVPFYSTERIATLEQLALTILREVEPRVLIIDEVHNLLAGSEREQRRALNVFKGLANRLRLVIIAVGTRDALQAFQTDEQIVRRFDPLELPRWTETDSFRSFIGSLARALPLRKPSPLTDRECVQFLLSRSDGITAHVCSIIGLAAEQAIRNGTESIDRTILEFVSDRQYLQPS